MGMLTLSAIEGWDTEHLESAARAWDTTAAHWEDTFTAVHQGSLYPGGTVWEGEGAEAAQQRTFADLVKVRGLSDHLYEAAKIARRGADQLDYLKRSALDAIDEARTAGFNVGQDLSVSDRSMVPLGPAFAARQAQAQTLAAEIRIRAAALSAADHQIAAEITSATAPLSGVAFDEEPAEPWGYQAAGLPGEKPATNGGGGGGRFKTAFGPGKDLPPLSPPPPTPTPEPPVPPSVQRQLDEQAKQIAEQGKQIAEQAASDGWSVSGAAEAAATGAATSASALYVGQLFLDPMKPPEEMNSALLYGAGTFGAFTGAAIYTVGKAAKAIVEDIQDVIEK